LTISQRLVFNAHLHRVIHILHDKNHVIIIDNMKSRLEDKNKAILLRKSGLSYKEIQKTIKTSKGVLSSWFRYLEFSEEEISRIEDNSREKQSKARLLASITNRYKRMEREKSVYTFAEKKFDKLKSESMFLVGISLYWAEGSKKTGEFQFMNSDPDMIIFMNKWIQKYLDINLSLIHI
jgi:hypothetical protein